LTELLGKAAKVYSQRIRRLEGERMGIEGTHDEIPEPICNMRKAMKNSNYFQGVALGPSDHYFASSSMEYYGSRDVGSVQDERKEDLIHLHSLPSISANGVLGQILFDVCVPQDVEDWDIKPFTSTRRHTPFNPIKCLRRSRL
jgi:hypothetical protein